MGCHRAVVLALYSLVPLALVDTREYLRRSAFSVTEGVCRSLKKTRNNH